MAIEFSSLQEVFEEFQRRIEQGVCPAGCGLLVSLGLVLGSELKECPQCGYSQAYPVRSEIQIISTVQ